MNIYRMKMEIEKNEESDRNEKSEKSIWIVNEWMNDWLTAEKIFSNVYFACWSRRQKEGRMWQMYTEGVSCE